MIGRGVPTRSASFAALMVLVACTSNPGAAPVPSPSLGSLGSLSAVSPNATPSPVTSGSRAALSIVHVRLVRVENLVDAIALATRPDDPNLYVGIRSGLVRAIAD